MSQGAISFGTWTPEGYARALEQFAKVDLERATIEAGDAGMLRARALAMSEARQHGILKAIFGAKPSGLPRLIAASKFKRAGTDLVAGGLRFKGLAGLQEAGGRTKQHVIKPRASGHLWLKTGGAQVRGQGIIGKGKGNPLGSVTHKGSNVRVFAVGQDALGRALPGIQRGMDDAIQALLRAKGIA